MKIMIDTNILVSGMLFKGNERQLLKYAQEKKFTLLVSDFSIAEARNVLIRKFPGKEYILDEIIRLLPVKIVPVPSQEKIKRAQKIIRDTKDAVILATAIESGLDAFVSGDKDFHTPEVKQVINVVNTADAVELVR